MTKYLQTEAKRGREKPKGHSALATGGPPCAWTLIGTRTVPGPSPIVFSHMS